MLSRSAEEALSARDLHELGAPVAHREHGVDPLETHDARLGKRRGALAEGREPRPKSPHELGARLGPADDFGDLDEAVEDAVERRRAELDHGLALELRADPVGEI